MKIAKISLLSIIILLSSLFLFACGKEKVPIENISFSKSEIELFIGNSTYLQLEISPEKANGFSVIWSSEDKTIASVNQQGKVTAKAYGSTTITAQIKNTEIKAECEVTVNDGEVFKIELNTDYVKKEYYEGETFDPSNIVVTAFYESGKEREIPSGEYQIIAPDTLSQNTNISVEYQGFSKSFEVTVTPDFANAIVVTTRPTKLTYFVGETFDPEGMIIQLHYASGKTQTITTFEYDTNPFAYNSNSVLITYNNLTTAIDVTVRAKYIVEDFSTLQSIIDNAIDGDSIMLAEGFYNTSKTITLPADKNIIIYGQTKDTQINAYNAPIFAIEGTTKTPHLTLANLTITLAQGENITLIQNPNNIPFNTIDVTIL